MRDTLRSEIGPFFVIPVAALYACAKNAPAFLVYAALSRHANRERRAWPSHQRLAVDLDTSERTIRRLIEDLRSLSLIRTETRRSENGTVQGTEYVLMAPHQRPNMAGSPAVKSDRNQRPNMAGIYKEELDPIELDPFSLGDFDRFWAIYPFKTGKDAARKAWVKRKPDATLVTLIVTALERQLPYLLRENGRFNLHPASWLNAGRWMDVGLPDPPKKRGEAPGPPVSLSPGYFESCRLNGHVPPCRSYGDHLRRFGVQVEKTAVDNTSALRVE